jgi:CBS domain containing-hemolysin-like protein
MDVAGKLKSGFRKLLLLLARRSLRSKSELARLVAALDFLPPAEANLILAAIKFPEVKLAQVMIPKSKISFIRETAHLGPKVLDELYSTGQKFFPVAQRSLEDTIGVIYLDDIAEVAKGEQTLQEATHLRPPLLRQKQPLIEVLRAMLDQNANLALVADEQGKIIGMVELVAILERLLGKR